MNHIVFTGNKKTDFYPGLLAFVLNVQLIVCLIDTVYHRIPGFEESNAPYHILFVSAFILLLTVTLIDAIRGQKIMAGLLIFILALSVLIGISATYLSCIDARFFNIIYVLAYLYAYDIPIMIIASRMMDTNALLNAYRPYVCLSAVFALIFLIQKDTNNGSFGNYGGRGGPYISYACSPGFI